MHMIFVLCLREKQANKETTKANLFISFELHLSDVYTNKSDSLSYIFILKEQKKEGLGRGVMFDFGSYKNICKKKSQETQVKC